MNAILLAALSLLSAGPTPVAPPDAAQLLRQGYTNMQAGKTVAAEQAYAAAVTLDNQREDAWAGLQWARAARGEWAAAAKAGAHLLALNPGHFYGQRRQGLALYMMGDFAQARTHYAAALNTEPQDATTLLGLGFTLLELGEPSQARTYCQRAHVTLPNDPRPGRCLARANQQRVRVGAAASTTYLHLSGTDTASDLSALSLSANITWPYDLNIWLGTTLTRTTDQDRTDWDQATLLGGIGILRGGFWANLTVGGLLADDPSTDGGILGLLDLGYQPAQLGGRAQISVASLGRALATQIDLSLIYAPARWLRISAGASLQLIRDPGYGARGLEFLSAARLLATVRPTERLAFSAGGFVGTERYRVEAGGLSVWTTPDQFTAGYTADLSYRPWRTLSVFLQFEHRFGDQQWGAPSDLQRIGGTFGLRADF